MALATAECNGHGLRILHRYVPLKSPTASVEPSGLSATALTPVGLPPVPGGSTSVAVRRRAAIFHRTVLPSLLPAASISPPGQEANARTSRNPTGATSLPASCPVAVIHRYVPCLFPVATSVPSGLNATLVTGLPLSRVAVIRWVARFHR